MAEQLTEKPAVTVLLPAHNAERFVAQSVESVLGQTFRDFELLAMDDGSTDATGSILDSFARRDSRVTVFHEPKQGLIATLNRGLRLARGKFLARQDADDESLPDRFRCQIEFLEAHPAVGVVGTAITVINTQGHPVRSHAYPLSNAEIKEWLKSGSAFAHPAVMMRAEALGGIGEYRKAFEHGEDYDLWLRLAEHWEMANLAEPLLRYRQHESQVSMNHVRKQMLSTLAARRCAELRRAGRCDPGQQVNLINVEFLCRIGVSETIIEEAIISAVITAAYNALDSGYPVLAEKLTREAEDMLPRTARRNYWRFYIRWMRGKIRLKTGRVSSGICNLLGAGVLNPALALKQAWLQRRRLGFS
jgi:hypothetical protein